MNSKIKMWQLAMLMLTITPITKFILLPASLSKILEQDSYILVLIYSIIDTLAILCILYCYKKSPNTSFYQILEGNFGKIIAKIIIGLYFTFFFLKTIAPIIEQKMMVTGNLYETTPRISTLIPLFILAGYISYKGAYALGRNANVLGFVSVISIIAILLLSIGDINFSNLLPIFDRSPSTLFEGFQSTLMWFGDFTIILFMLGKITQKQNKIKSLVWTYVIAQILIITFYIILISIYGEITERQVHAISKISKFNTALSNLGRFDWIPIILLLVCFMMAVTTTFYCSNECVYLMFPKPKKAYTTVAVTILYCIIALILQDNLKMLYEFIIGIYNYLAIILQYIIPFCMPLLFLNYKRGEKKREAFQYKKPA